MRIALYGGSFNPPHVAHQLSCAYVLATARPRVDQVWMIPTFHHPFAKVLAPYADRVAMCERAAPVFAGRVLVSRIEEELGGESYTLNTVKALRARHPDHQFALVIGADLVAERERWHGWPELKTLIEFIVVGRQGQPDVGAALDLPPVSSTELRALVARGETVDGWMDAGVVDYIRERGLYQ
jgi:nicotinate-nucleotide adenylyltransferase